MSRSLKSGYGQTGCLAIKYDHGIIVASDNQLLTYHRCTKDAKRFFPINSHCVLTSNGDYADLLWTVQRLQIRQMTDEFENDGNQLDAPRLANLLNHVIYEQRLKPEVSKASYIVFGRDSQINKPFMAMVLPQSTLIKDEDILTNGLCSYQTISIIRKKIKQIKQNTNNPSSSSLNLNQAVDLLQECLAIQAQLDRSCGFFYRMCDFNLQYGMILSDIHKIKLDFKNYNLRKELDQPYNSIC